MKRSNRLILLLGIVFAIAAFVLVFVTLNSRAGPPGGSPEPVAQVDVVVAREAIPLGTAISDENVEVQTRDVGDPVLVGAVRSLADVEGQAVRRDIAAGSVLTREAFSTQTTAENETVMRALPAGMRAMAVQVDQVTGVGTLIQPGDRVDVIMAISDTDAKFPIVTIVPEAEREEVDVITKLDDGLYNGTTVKALVQNVQVLGTLLPPPPEETNQQAEPEQTQDPEQPTDENEQGTALTGQQQIVIIAVTAQQSELIRFTQLDGNLSLVLRSTEDEEAPPDETTGITLATLYDEHGVLKPQLFELDPITR
ncbi:MAG: Flp pilus assembly protein CpaB [Chloroflexi bacterium]|nr:Flp pilus assembly protein CpaB [Chloroflexota bacterium]